MKAAGPPPALPRQIPPLRPNPRGPLPSLPNTSEAKHEAHLAPLPVALIKSPTRLDSFKFIQAELVAPKSANQLSTHGRSSSTGVTAKKFPRLVTVVNSYNPTQPDELFIKVGETLRLLEEFKDGWCSVQRVGRIDAEKGVAPRFCLEERAEFVSTLNSLRPPQLLLLGHGRSNSELILTGRS